MSSWFVSSCRNRVSLCKHKQTPHQTATSFQWDDSSSCPFVELRKSECLRSHKWEETFKLWWKIIAWRGKQISTQNWKFHEREVLCPRKRVFLSFISKFLYNLEYKKQQHSTADLKTQTSVVTWHGMIKLTTRRCLEYTIFKHYKRNMADIGIMAS